MNSTWTICALTARMTWTLLQDIHSTLLLTETQLYPLRQFNMVVKSATMCTGTFGQDATRASADSCEDKVSGHCSVLLAWGAHPLYD